MERKPFLKQFRFILPFGLAILLISSPTSGEEVYSVDLVTPSYIEASTVLPYFYDDAACFDVTLPFPFTFYKVAYTHAYVAIDGYLSFTQCTSDYRNSPLPTPSPNGAIFAFWDDLYVDKDANVASVRTMRMGSSSCNTVTSPLMDGKWAIRPQWVWRMKPVTARFSFHSTRLPSRKSLPFDLLILQSPFPWTLSLGPAPTPST
jgi:hypothetical protein